MIEPPLKAPLGSMALRVGLEIYSIWKSESELADKEIINKAINNAIII